MTKKTASTPRAPTPTDSVIAESPIENVATIAIGPDPRIAELEAKLAGADQACAAAQLERDAARKALDAALEEPCSLCGKQRKDTP